MAETTISPTKKQTYPTQLMQHAADTVKTENKVRELLSRGVYLRKGIYQDKVRPFLQRYAEEADRRKSDQRYLDAVKSYISTPATGEAAHNPVASRIKNTGKQFINEQKRIWSGIYDVLNPNSIRHTARGLVAPNELLPRTKPDIYGKYLLNLFSGTASNVWHSTVSATDKLLAAMQAGEKELSKRPPQNYVGGGLMRALGGAQGLPVSGAILPVATLINKATARLTNPNDKTAQSEAERLLSEGSYRTKLSEQEILSSAKEAKHLADKIGMRPWQHTTNEYLANFISNMYDPVSIATLGLGRNATISPWTRKLRYAGEAASEAWIEPNLTFPDYYTMEHDKQRSARRQIALTNRLRKTKGLPPLSRQEELELYNKTSKFPLINWSAEERLRSAGK